MNKIELLKVLNFKNDPTYLCEVKSILNNYSEITQILNIIDEIEKIKICFLYKKRIHDILYEVGEYIYINKIYFRLSYNFPLNILIKDKPFLINYIYDPKLIIELDKLNRNNNNQLKKLIFSKIILDLIKNAVGFDSIDDNTENSLNIIKTFNQEIIIKSNTILKEYKLNYNIEEFVNKTIDEIYIELIINLINDKIFEKCKVASKIMIQLDLENIKITKIMEDKLNEILNSKEIAINYALNKIKDLDKKRINFYYILLKYILKNSIFIYNFSILYKAKQFFIKIIKEKKGLYIFMRYYFNYHKYVERLEYIIKTLTDSEYYYNKYFEFINYGITNSKNIELRKNKNIFESSENYNCLYYIINILYQFSITINIYFTKKEMIINYEFNINYYKDKIDYEHLICIKNELLKIANKNKKQENFIKFMAFLENIKDSLINSYKGKQNIKIKLELNKNAKDLVCLYSFFSEKSNKNFSYKDEIILNDNCNFLFLLDDLNDEFKDSQNDSNQIIIDITTIDEKNSNQNDFNIMKFIYKIGNLEKSKIIKQLSNGCYIIFGESFFSLYDCLNNTIVEKYNFEGEINNLWEYGKSSDKINLLISIQNKIKIISIDVKRPYKNKEIIESYDYNINCLYIFEMEINKITNLIRYYNNKNDNKAQNQIITSDYSGEKYICTGNFELKDLKYVDININIDNHIVYDTNMKIMNEIIILLKNICRNKNEDNEVINNYIINSENGLCFIPKKINELFNILLISYNKKEKGIQKYGILLTILSPDNTVLNTINKDTGNFKVNCFCPILLIENNRINTYNLENYKNIEIILTNYFIAAGYDYEEKEGKLKLFEICKDDTYNISMKEKHDIKPKNFAKFESPIISMIQSVIDGQIIILDSSGNVYYFTSPDIK